jgi:cytidyltransferase-like protein
VAKIKSWFLSRFLHLPPHLHKTKVKNMNNLLIAAQFIRNQKKTGKRVVVVTGCFDILTDAHIGFLMEAKSYGDILVVGIEDDIRVKAFKGPHRPINTVSQRIEIMESLSMVDLVFVISGSITKPIIEFYSQLHSILREDFVVDPLNWTLFTPFLGSGTGQ